ncbi:MAG TPA: protein kinase [Pyrinomonadaceae bacterium]|jgi:serine/threonine protein kinase|nr:protein kinase [Pyrinomonadaceae bacterium]
MTPERWQKIETVLQGALDLPPSERRTFLAEACAGDAELNREISSLAEAHDRSGDFIEAPALVSDAEQLFRLGESNIGREIGPYKIVAQLGLGGMGEVYLANDQRLDRQVALKILPGYLSDEIRLSRFRKEARAASGLNHPNIITIYEVGEQDEVRFIATEFIEGVTLRELISSRKLSLRTALEIAEQVCAALSAAHDAGIVHRDIKPENIMQRPDGIVKLLDFGIAKLTEQTSDAVRPNYTQTDVGLVLGTVNYMSPEQARALAVDEGSDIWSLGVVLFEMLANRLPFTAATRLDTMVAILERDPEPLFQTDRPEFARIESIVLKCLAKDVELRYQSAYELLADLKQVSLIVKDLDLDTAAPSLINSSQSTQSPITLWKKGERHHLQKRSVVMLAAVFLLFAIVSSVFIYRRMENRSVEASIASPTPKLYWDMTEDERLAFIDQQEQRVSTLMGDRPAKLNGDALQAIKKDVDRYVQRVSVTSKKQETIAVVFGRAQPYLPTIGRSFRERKVPVIIGVYLPMVESEYQACFESEAGGKGLFQFLPGTAAQYGVSLEEMCDAEKMTPAAAHYIADRMAELGDDSQSLTLVLLSYTTGPEWVRSTMRDLRERGNYERNFWTIFEQRRLLDKQFQDGSAYYVPSFFAAAIIGENPEAFGLSMPPLSSLAGE